MNSSAHSQAAALAVVVGGANMDVMGRARGSLVATDSTPGEVTVSPGGVARNVAENLARLGQTVRLISAVGDDEFGRRLLRETRAAGVNVDAFQCIPGGTTASYVALSGPDGTLRAAVNDMRVIDQLSPAWFEAHRATLTAATVLVLDCNLSGDALGWLMKNAPRASVFVDATSAAKCGRLRPWLNKIHSLKLNRLEAEALTGRPVKNLSDAQAAAAVLQAAGVHELVISLGGQGVFWCDQEGGCGLQAVRKIQVVNTNGAGDALLAGLVYGHMRRMTLTQAIEWGAACAEMTLLSPSANRCDLSVKAVEQWLQTQVVTMPP
jgi:pseudouridine kinase